jgi:hypothetical protein
MRGGRKGEGEGVACVYLLQAAGARCSPRAAAARTNIPRRPSPTNCTVHSAKSAPLQTLRHAFEARCSQLCVTAAKHITSSKPHHLQPAACSCSAVNPPSLRARTSYPAANISPQPQPHALASAAATPHSRSCRSCAPYFSNCEAENPASHSCCNERCVCSSWMLQPHSRSIDAVYPPRSSSRTSVKPPPFLRSAAL